MADSELDKTVIIDPSEAAKESESLDDLDFDLAGDLEENIDDEPLITDDLDFDNPTPHETQTPSQGLDNLGGGGSDDDWEETVQALPDDNYDNDPFTGVDETPPGPEPESDFGGVDDFAMPADEDPPTLDPAPSGEELLQSPAVESEADMPRKASAEATPASNRGQLLTLASLAVAVISLVVALVFGVMILNAQTEISSISENVEAIQSRPAAAPGDLAQETLEALRNALGEISQKVVDLETAMDGHADQGQVNDLMAEIKDLERRLNGLENAGTQSAALPRPSPAPAPVKPEKVATANGWYINLVSFSRRANALSTQARFAKAGYQTELQRTEVDGREWYRLRMGGFPNREAALTKQREVRQALDVKNSWITDR